MAALNLHPGLGGVSLPITIMSLVRPLAANMPSNRSMSLTALLDRQQSSTTSLSLSLQILSHLCKLFLWSLAHSLAPF